MARIRIWLKFGGVVTGVLLFYAFMMVGDRRLTPSRAQGDVELSPRQKLGIDVLEQALGDKAPTGRGIVFGHVEGAAGDYAPREDADYFRGVTFHLNSGPGKVSGHADATCRQIYGPEGLAPGVKDVYNYTAQDWMTKGYLRTDSAEQSAVNDCRIFTNSWIGQNEDFALFVLRRIDFLADERDILFIVGVDNGRDKPVPALLSSSYNSIAVGVWDGNSSGGGTRVDGAGRCKPDIVAPHNLSSFSTPMVAAVVARLLETADHHPQSAAAKHSEVIKAVLLTGAHKPGNWQRAVGRSMDDHLGAGQARADQSYGILIQPQSPPNEGLAPIGWDFHTVDRGGRAAYEVTVDKPVGPVAITLVWNRRIIGRTVTDPMSGKTAWHNGARLADFDLRLVQQDGDDVKIIGRSTSDVDNVEHIWFPQLPSGHYVMHVTRKDELDERWDYAIAWRFGDWQPKP